MLRRLVSGYLQSEEVSSKKQEKRKEKSEMKKKDEKAEQVSLRHEIIKLSQTLEEMEKIMELEMQQLLEKANQESG